MTFYFEILNKIINIFYEKMFGFVGRLFDIPEIVAGF